MKKISEIKEDWLKCQINILKSKSISKADIARDLGVLPQYINSITSGKRGISDIFLDKFISHYKINQYDLFANTKITIPSANQSSSNNETLRYLMDKVESQAKEIGRLETTVEQLRSEIKKRNEIDALNAATSSIANVG